MLLAPLPLVAGGLATMFWWRATDLNDGAAPAPVQLVGWMGRYFPPRALPSWRAAMAALVASALGDVGLFLVGLASDNAPPSPAGPALDTLRAVSGAVGAAALLGGLAALLAAAAYGLRSVMESRDGDGMFDTRAGAFSGDERFSLEGVRHSRRSSFLVAVAMIAGMDGLMATLNATVLGSSWRAPARATPAHSAGRGTGGGSPHGDR